MLKGSTLASWGDVLCPIKYLDEKVCSHASANSLHHQRLATNNLVILSHGRSHLTQTTAGSKPFYQYQVSKALECPGRVLEGNKYCQHRGCDGNLYSG